MTAHILGWNPDVWNDWDYDQVIEEVSTSGAWRDRWSVGNHVHVNVGASAWLYRQGNDEPGLIGHGTVTSTPYVDVHYSNPAGVSNYVDVVFDHLLPVGEQVPRDLLESRVPGVKWRYIFQSGWFVHDDDEMALGKLWAEFASTVLADPLEMLPGSFSEGTATQVYLTRYERSPRARAACIAAKGSECLACGFSFEATYGELGHGFVHVHHVVPVSQMGADYQLDPVRDLVPLCANCHAMAHRGVSTPRNVDELRDLINR